jgi:hypothetical protein
VAHDTAVSRYTHIAREDDVRCAAQLDKILRPNAPKNENGLESGVSKPFPVN